MAITDKFIYVCMHDDKPVKVFSSKEEALSDIDVYDYVWEFKNSESTGKFWKFDWEKKHYVEDYRANE